MMTIIIIMPLPIRSSESFALGSRSEITKEDAIGFDTLGAAFTVSPIATGRLVALGATRPVVVVVVVVAVVRERSVSLPIVVVKL